MRWIVLFVLVNGLVWTLGGQEADTLAHAVPNPYEAAPGRRTRVVVPLSWSRVRVEIYTIRGSYVTRLRPTPLEGGQEEWVWDGRNDERIDCLPGMYLVRVVHTLEGNLTNHVFPLRLTRPAVR